MRILNYFVYILKCNDESYYTGITNDVERRVYEHNSSNDESSYTFDKRPVKLMFYEAFKDVNQAIAFEKKVKGWTRKKKEALIENNWDKLKELSVCLNDTSHKNIKHKSEQPFDSAQGDSTTTKHIKNMTTPESFLTSAQKQFLYYKTLGEKAINQLEPEQLFFAANNDTNSIYIIVKHLHGNMLSRWTDFLTTDGEKEWRNRDGEFDDDSNSDAARHPELVSGSPEMLKHTDSYRYQHDKEELLNKWNEGWDCLFNALKSLSPEQLSQIVYIRNEGQTVVEAINRQLCHYSYHVGQIVFYAKMLKKTEWNSLSIPKNKSKDYNTDKFSKEKSTKHFTDDELGKLK